MVLYRRIRVAGGTYFFTVTLRDRTSTLLVERIDQLCEALRETKQVRPFYIDAMVVLPEHLHAIWTLPADDDDFSGRWRAIKAQFTRALVGNGVGIRRNPKGEYNLWQRRFWEHTVRDEPDLRRHVEYIHFNPVKHGLVTQVRDWLYSSFHRYVRAGVYPLDWAGSTDPDNEVSGFGERNPDFASLHPGYAPRQ
jgi:putative transposase